MCAEIIELPELFSIKAAGGCVKAEAEFSRISGQYQWPEPSQQSSRPQQRNCSFADGRLRFRTEARNDFCVSTVVSCLESAVGQWLSLVLEMLTQSTDPQSAIRGLFGELHADLISGPALRRAPVAQVSGFHAGGGAHLGHRDRRQYSHLQHFGRVGSAPAGSAGDGQSADRLRAESRRRPGCGAGQLRRLAAPEPFL